MRLLYLVTIWFSKSFQKVFNLFRWFESIFERLCVSLGDSFLFHFRANNTHGWLEGEKRHRKKMEKWLPNVCLVWWNVSIYICSGTDTGFKCTRNVSSIQLLTVLYVSIHSTFAICSMPISNASNGVSWCTRLRTPFQLVNRKFFWKEWKKKTSNRRSNPHEMYR